jgi:histidyl-tRNA synthetase
VSEVPKFRAIKGTRDILPAESALWNHVEQAAREVFATYGFQEIRPPFLEDYDLFVRSVGEHSDIVAKELLISWDAPVDQWDVWRLSLSKNFNVDTLPARFADQLLRHGEETHFAESMWVPDPLKSDDVRKYLVEAWKKSFELSPDWAQFRNYLQHVSQLNEWTKVALRPEATASVCRAYIEHGMHTLPGNVKLYYIGPMFRRERPQKGRYRQFYQIGAEVLGPSDAPAIDAELIEMLMAFFDRAGLPQTHLFVNSIGCKDCRPKYVELLRAELQKVKDKLGPDSQRRIDTNPLRVLDSKLPEEQAIIEKLPRIADHLCDACKQHFAALKDELALRDIAYEINWRLVRGLDYYTRTTFEVTAAGLGSQNAVCGGGRYDGLVELLGGPPTKGIGFAIGTDRVILALEDAGKGQPKPRVDVFLAWMGAAAYAPAVKLARRLRREGFAVELPPEEMKFKKSLGLADKLGAAFALILGEDEVASGQLTLKRLSDGSQQKLAEPELLAYLKSNLRDTRA